jgi:hypothetical protein
MNGAQQPINNPQYDPYQVHIGQVSLICMIWYAPFSTINNVHCVVYSL